MAAGDGQARKFKAILFGKEGETKDIKVSLQYKPEGADRIIIKERIYQVQVDSAPLVLRVTHDESYLSGSLVEIVASVQSNALRPITNLLLEVDYPFGFDYASSTQEALAFDNIFGIGSLRPGETKEIKIYGYILGQDDEQRSFRYKVGTRSSDSPDQIDAIFSVNDSQILIAKPAISLSPKVNGDTQPIYLASAGQNLDLVIDFSNNLGSRIFDTELTLQLDGAVYDKKSVQVDAGFYSSAQNQIIWSSADLPALAEMGAGVGDKLGVRITILPVEVVAGLLEDPEIVLTYTIVGKAFDEAGGEREVVVTDQQRIKVASDIGFFSELLFSQGPFENVGSLSPVAEKETSYTVHWQLTNTTSKLENTAVKAKLPSGVRYRNLVSPANAAFSYDQKTREVVWNAGLLEPQLGYILPTKEIYFNIGVLPSLNQIGSRVVLIEEQTAEGVDSFTGLKRVSKVGPLDSALEDDPEFQTGDGVVVD